MCLDIHSCRFQYSWHFRICRFIPSIHSSSVKCGDAFLLKCFFLTLLRWWLNKKSRKSKLGHVSLSLSQFDCISFLKRRRYLTSINRIYLRNKSQSSALWFLLKNKWEKGRKSEISLNSSARGIDGHHV